MTKVLQEAAIAKDIIGVLKTKSGDKI